MGIPSAPHGGFCRVTTTQETSWCPIRQYFTLALIAHDGLPSPTDTQGRESLLAPLGRARSCSEVSQGQESLIWWYSRFGNTFNAPTHLKGHGSGLHKQVCLLASGQ